MSVQFGRWNLDGKPVDYGYLDSVGAALGPYATDGEGSYCNKNIAILYYSFHTTKESRSEAQPQVSKAGAVITWDGRLDNRAELISELGGSLNRRSTDVAIVAEAYDTWAVRCFGKLTGDWALSIWNSNSRSLVLAKDPIGTRNLYYRFDNNETCWSSVLDPLVRLAGRTFALDEEYIAGWLSMFPAAHLTPWVGVHAVPPSSFVLLGPGKHVVSKYWDFNPSNRICYKTDAEYEEHFRTVFATSVRRRLRSDRPILAELSGGRDSSSIVCIADDIIARGAAEVPRLDTISYYDDSEPNWNERPYFTKIEEKRGRMGCHINVGSTDLEPWQEAKFSARPSNGHLFSVPGSSGRTSRQLKDCLTSQGNRVILSGIGGDEVMGGVPTPVPEIEDLLAQGHFRVLVRQLKVWALEKRKPWILLLWESAKEFLPPALAGVPRQRHPPPWLRSAFVKRYLSALTGYPSRTKLFGALPSFQANISALDDLRRQLVQRPLPFDPVFERRYPYLDCDLLQFVFAIAREQLVRPRQRRSLMRRALVGIVPEYVLNRKTKAFIARAPLMAISRDWIELFEMAQNMVSSALEVVDPTSFVEILHQARLGQDEISSVALMRTISIERWLRNLGTLGHEIRVSEKPASA
jgi:asparagine synthase (glutamine-hydrolysing)